MSYYTGRGDYYSGKGDPGLFSSIGSIVGGISKVASKIPGPIGLVGSAVSSALGGRSTASSSPSSRLTMPSVIPSIPAIPSPGLSGTIARAVPGGSSGYQCGSGACSPGFHLDKTTKSKCVRNRKTNYTNPRALARASKRLDGFVTVARRALRSTNYKVVSKSFKQNWRKPLKR